MLSTGVKMLGGFCLFPKPESVLKYIYNID